jgi:hypothetical protein
MVAIVTVKRAVFTVLPLIVIDPLTELLRPTAVCDWPARLRWISADLRTPQGHVAPAGVTILPRSAAALEVVSEGTLNGR